MVIYPYNTGAEIKPRKYIVEEDTLLGYSAAYPP
jgi:hypothetical protein